MNPGEQKSGIVQAYLIVYTVKLCLRTGWSCFKNSIFIKGYFTELTLKKKNGHFVRLLIARLKLIISVVLAPCLFKCIDKGLGVGKETV